jgi:excisionase family DNA binding protein
MTPGRESEAGGMAPLIREILTILAGIQDQAPMAFLKVLQVAEHLQTSPALVYQLCAEKKIPHVRVGMGRGAIRIDEADLAAFIETCRVGPHGMKNTAGLKHIRLPVGE